MDKLFLDANVVVDFLCERSDFYLPAARLMVNYHSQQEGLRQLSASGLCADGISGIVYG